LLSLTLADTNSRHIVTRQGRSCSGLIRYGIS